MKFGIFDPLNKETRSLVLLVSPMFLGLIAKSVLGATHNGLMDCYLPDAELDPAITWNVTSGLWLCF